MAVQEINYYGPAEISANGILACFVQQPVANTPAETTSGATYSEKWKGPYLKGKEVLSNIKVGDALSAFHTWLGDNRVSRYDAPSCPIRFGDGSHWVITGIRVDEHTAGDHCYINIDCTPNITESSSDPLVEDTESNVWSITWQSYSVTPYEFCSGQEREMIGISPSLTVEARHMNWSLPASRGNIEDFKSHSPKIVTSEENDGEGNVTATHTAYTYLQPKSTVYRQCLSPCEVEVYKKAMLNRNATYHYPVVTHSTSFIGGATTAFTTALGGSLDTITTLPSECPYTFAPFPVGDSEKNWKWIKIADDMSQTKTETTTRFDRKEVWAGFTDVDENYYGNSPFNHDSEIGVTQGRWYKNCL